MTSNLLTSREEVVEHRRRINTIRGAIEYDVINSPINTEFEELEVILCEAVNKLDEIDDKMKEHVYAYDVTITVTLRVYVKGDDESIAEDAAIEYALHDLSPGIDWNEDDISAERREDEETTEVYDVEV